MSDRAPSLTLYYMPRTVAAAVAIALEEAGLAYETRLVDFTQNAQTGPDYLAVNPNGRVPALDVDGTILTETGAILDFVHTLAPSAGLIPADPLAAARVREVMYFLASTMHIAHAHRTRGYRWAAKPESQADMLAKVPETMAACAQQVESRFLAGPLVLGEALTAADPYLFVVSRWLESDGVAVSSYPALSRFMAAMEARESVKRVIGKGILPVA
jgi:glutathione S-transferase